MALLSLAACTDTLPTGSAVDSRNAASASVSAPDQPSRAVLDAFANVLARGLSDSAMRMAVLEDLRDSPFDRHKVHLDSYITGKRGRANLAAIARASAIPPDSLLRLASALRNYELWMPSVTHRTRWSGTSDVVVVATTMLPSDMWKTPAEYVAYDVSGAASTVNLLGHNPKPYLLVAPARQSFGKDPEVARAAAPKQPRRTISTRETEFTASIQSGSDTQSSTTLSSAAPQQSSMSSSCNPEVDGPDCCDETTIYCPNPPEGNGTAGVGMGFTFEDCVKPFNEPIAESLDRDYDHILDSCESQLAKAFEPRLVFHPSENHKGREPYYAVNRSADGQRVRIIYALSYYWDPGFRALDGTYGHAGDSEFIIVHVGRYIGYNVPGKWQVHYVTYSAHFDSADDYTRTYWWSDAQYSTGEFGIRPLVYVALDKHANYRSHSECDAGAWYSDDCYAAGPSPELAGIPSTANLGNVHAGEGFPQGTYSGRILTDCVPSRVGGAGKHGTECYWSTWLSADFAGWTGGTVGSKAYGAIFFYYVF